jgi:hypothetical protein
MVPNKRKLCNEQDFELNAQFAIQRHTKYILCPFGTLEMLVQRRHKSLFFFKSQYDEKRENLPQEMQQENSNSL